MSRLPERRRRAHRSARVAHRRGSHRLRSTAVILEPNDLRRGCFVFFATVPTRDGRRRHPVDSFASTDIDAEYVRLPAAGGMFTQPPTTGSVSAAVLDDTCLTHPLAQRNRLGPSSPNQRERAAPPPPSALSRSGSVAALLPAAGAADHRSDVLAGSKNTMGEMVPAYTLTKSSMASGFAGHPRSAGISGGVARGASWPVNS